MEVGAVKQAFNNEVILLKKKLNQARIQIIHKLTRKAKQLAEKKAPEPLKEKLKRKAESAVNEVLIIKKIKPKDLAQFMVTHKGELKDFLNKPIVNNEKACARLLLHKALQDKYKFIRGRFSNVPIQDLFMSRLERKKMKKEEKEKRKNKKKGKDNKVVNSEGDWNVEDVDIGDQKDLSNIDDNENEFSDENGPDENSTQNRDETESQGDASEQSDAENVLQDYNKEICEEEANTSEPEEQNSEPELAEVSKPINIVTKSKGVLPQKQLTKNKPIQTELNLKQKEVNLKKPEKKVKDINKNKNFNEKILQRKFKKDSDAPNVGNKIVDPFFITSTGENYMSVVEPRAPDEVKAEHKQGNRKLRRAIMFGYEPKIKPRRENNNYRDDNRFNKQNSFDKSDNFTSKFNNKREFIDRQDFNNDFNNRKIYNDNKNDEKPEKLHPSWEAKKKKSGILPFEGKKIVFD